MADTVPNITLTDSQYKDPEALDQDGLGPGKTPDTQSRTEPPGEPIPFANGKASPTKLWARPGSPAHRTSQRISTGNMEGSNESQAVMDPLSQHIFQRTNTATSIVQKLRTPTDNGPNTPSASAGEISADPKHPADTVRTDTGIATKKKGVSFLSRFIGNKKKGVSDGDYNENESEQGDSRPEGMDAQPFSRPVDNIGFNPRHPQPPGYIKVRSRYKKEKELDRVFLAQELRGQSTASGRTKSSHGRTTASGNAPTQGNDPIWAMEFSKDGKYLAAGGQDKILRVWAVLSSPEERRAHEKEEEAATGVSEGQTLHLDAPVFRKNTFREYIGHTSTILDLSWSKNNFLLSSSMDKTVRLWHVSRTECLCTFKHSDFVPSIQFHPRDDRFFLAGSLDAKLRLWSIPDKSVAFWNQLPDMITAVAFTPDGKTAIAGTLGGTCIFYETEGLKYGTQIHVRSTHGKNAKGSKITGIQAINIPPDNLNGEVKLLISSNDSRIRMYNYRDKSLEIKFKGHQNDYSQIRATFNDDARYVVCGSEDRKAYIWSTSPAEGEKRNQKPMEMFEAHTSIATSALLAPTKTRQLLSSSEDPIYDLCNPPPVTLLSRSESMTSSKPPSRSGSIQATPATAEGTFKRAEVSPAYVARSTHPDGQIIVTADYTGHIKVFRQDCAHNKRRRDSWETSSVFSKRMGSKTVGRTASVITHGSRTSMARSDSIGTQPPSDRILSWRQGITSSGSLDLRNGRNTRSTSPRKSIGQSSITSFNRARFGSNPALPNSTTDTLPSTNTTSSSPSRHDSNTHITQPTKHRTSNTAPSADENPLWIAGGQSNVFWNTDAWREQMQQTQHNSLAPPRRPSLRPKGSVVSALSSEESSLMVEEEDGDDASRGGKEGGRELEGEVKCRKCGGTVFKARMVKSEGYGLVCSRCGTPA